MRIVWTTDLHLDDVKEDGFNRFIDTVNDANADALFITGDIGDGKTFVDQIPLIQKKTAIPLYFILGNHDFYDQTIQEAKKEAEQLDRSNHNIYYLTVSKPFKLNTQWTLIGHDGWADGKCGDFLNSPVKLADSLKIHDLMNISLVEQKEKLARLGEEAALSIRERLEEALSQSRHVILMTHCPPFRLACRYKGVIADDDWAPHFICQSIGDVITEMMTKHKKKELIVLCGHAHYPSDIKVLPNVRVMTGGGEIGYPKVEKVLTL